MSNNKIFFQNYETNAGLYIFLGGIFAGFPFVPVNVTNAFGGNTYAGTTFNHKPLPERLFSKAIGSLSIVAQQSKHPTTTTRRVIHQTTCCRSLQDQYEIYQRRGDTRGSALYQLLQSANLTVRELLFTPEDPRSAKFRPALEDYCASTVSTFLRKCLAIVERLYGCTNPKRRG